MSVKIRKDPDKKAPSNPQRPAIKSAGRSDDARRYRYILDSIEESYFEVDLAGNLEFFNERVPLDLGYTREELRNIHFSKLTDEINKTKVYKVFHDVFESGRSVKAFDWEILKKNGERLYVESSVALIRDEAGNPAGFRGVVRDVSQRKQVERDLKESEAKYRTILQDMDEAYLETDLRGNYIFFNDALCRLLGYSRRELQGISFKRINPPDVLDRVSKAFGNIYRSGKTSRFIAHEVICKDGSSRHLETTASLRRSPEGKPIGFAMVSRDITEKLQAETKVLDSERHLRLITDNISDVIWTMDFGLRFTYVSPSVLPLTGFTPDEILGLPLKSIVAPELYAERKRILSEALIRDSRTDLRDEEKIKSFEMQMPRKDGSSFWAEVTTDFNRDEDGKPFEIVGITRDITARKKAEEALRKNEKRYRMLAENVNDVVWIIGLDLSFKYASPSQVKLLGWTPERARSITVRDVVSPEGLDLILRGMAEELELEASGKPFDPNRSKTVEVECYAEDGRSVWLELTGTFNRDANGRPTEILAVGRDITRSKLMAQALAESERRYRMIAENMNDMIWVMGLDLHFRYVSPSSLRITGYTPEETIRTPLAEMLTPESYLHATKRLADELDLEASGQPFDPNRAMTMEIEAIRKDSSTLWLEITGTFNRDKNGTATEILLVGRNITSKKIAERALAETQMLYRIIVENIKDSVSLLDLDFNYIYLSPSEVRITGYQPEELMKIPIREQTTPESHALMESIFAEEIVRECSGEPVDFNRSRTVEVEVYHKKGGKVWVELVFTFTRDESGKPDGILRTARDVTERRKIQDALRESENRYRSILDSIQEIIWTTDLNLQTTYVSPSSLQITGYTPDEARKIPLSELLTPDSFEFAQKLLAEELVLEASGDSVDPYRTRTLEQEIYHKNGGTVLMEVTATFIRDKDETANGLLLAARDISERKRAEEEKEKLQKQLIQAQKMESVGRLAGGVAHDFNNMLSVILGYVDLAKGRLAKQHPVLKDIGEIEKAALRSRDITAQLLAFSRKQIITPVVIDLNELVYDTQKALVRLIGEDIELSYRPAEDLWAIRFDPSQIEQILINLAVNARDAMPEGGKLTIETTNIVLDAFYCVTHAGFRPGEYVRLTVSDNGTGMDRETLQYIFEPFFTTKEEGKGTGLGLATVYGIIKQNNGFVNVYSEPGQGTTFTIYFPRTTEKREIEPEKEEEEPITGGAHILLVEDDPMVLEITKDMLESLDYDVTVAEGPLDAISICEKNSSVDLVITDVVMPVMKGKELRDRLEQIRPGIKVLFMSGYTANVIAHHGVLEDGVHFLQKPFTIKGLGKKVAEVLASNK